MSSLSSWSLQGGEGEGEMVLFLSVFVMITGGMWKLKVLSLG